MSKSDSARIERNFWITVEQMLSPEDRETMNLRQETDSSLWFLRICTGFQAMREKLLALGYDWEYVEGVKPIPKT